MTGKRVYLAGPMSGLPDHGFGAMIKAATELREAGYEVFCPAENASDGAGNEGAAAEGSLGRAHFMRIDIQAIVGYMTLDWRFGCPKVDYVAVLPGWETSRGARLEVEIAMQLDIPVVGAWSFEPVTVQELNDARRIIPESYLLPNYNGVAA